MFVTVTGAPTVAVAVMVNVCRCAFGVGGLVKLTTVGLDTIVKVFVLDVAVDWA